MGQPPPPTPPVVPGGGGTLPGISAALNAVFAASVTNKLIVSGIYRRADGSTGPFGRVFAHTTGDRTTETAPIVANVPGDIIALSVAVQDSGVKRGQAYVSVRLTIASGVESWLCAGYVYDGFPLTLGHFVEPGPAGGPGNRRLLTLASDVAGNVVTTTALAATNTVRKWYGFQWFYNASGDVAARGLVWGLRDLSSTLPTGFASGASSDALAFAGPTIDADQEGGIFVMAEDGAISHWNNDGGNLTSVSSVNGVGFPYTAMEDDLGDIILSATNGHANDRYSAYGYIEEWLVI